MSTKTDHIDWATRPGVKLTGLTQLAQGEEAFLRHLAKRGVTSERPDVSVVQLNNLIAIRV